MINLSGSTEHLEVVKNGKFFILELLSNIRRGTNPGLGKLENRDRNFGILSISRACISVQSKVALGPVVQSIVSLTSSLAVKMLTVLVSTISNSHVFLLKKNVSSFCKCKSYSHFFSAKI